MDYILRTIALMMLVGTFCCQAQSRQQRIEQEENSSRLIWEVKTSKTLAKINPDMYGIFFEDINFAADGGLYAEMVKNRSFEFPQSLMGWRSFGQVEVLTQEAPFERNPHYARLRPSGHAHKMTGLENEGFRGMGFQAGKEYRFSVWARSGAGPQKLSIVLVSEDDREIGRRDLTIDGGEWKKYSLTLTPRRTESRGRLRILYDRGNSGYADVEHISLFPVDTWRGHENGLRRDLAQALADLHPGVLRFPGGCIVEGTDLATRYQWKNSVGPVENRPLNENRWNYTFANRMFPDYYQSYGLGFFEYFQLAEEIGAAPLPVLSVGLACQYQNNDMRAHVPLDELQPYIQDALDLIEFANGGPDTKWGALRVEMGHSEPFHMKYLAIGNEQWGPEYVERLERFVQALRRSCPDILIVGSAGPSAAGDRFNYLWPEMRRLKTDLVDEHYYMAPDWFLQNAGRYDGYDRKGPKVFAGEYAAHDKGNGKANNFRSALAEACFMTGLERNADVVRLATYAPLFAHVDAWQWNPDLIWFDNLRLFKTPNWYVQQLYARYKGTDVLAAYGSDRQPLSGQQQIYASAVRDKDGNTLILKIGNCGEKSKTMDIRLSGLKRFQPVARLICYQSKDMNAVNSLDAPEHIVPETGTLVLGGTDFVYEAPAQSFSVIIIPLD